MLDPGDTSSSRIGAVLAGESALVFGMTFVPTDALEALRWGDARGPARLRAAICERLRLDFAFVPSWEPWAEDASDRILAVGTQVFWVVRGPFGLVAGERGWATTLRDTVADPARLRARLDDGLPREEERVRRGARLGAAAIVVAEDLAGGDGPFIAPDYAIDEIVPRLGALAQTAAEEALPSILHSDGDFRTLVPSLRLAGFAAIHPGGLTEGAFDKTCRVAWDNGLAVVGGLPGDAMRRGGPAALRAGAAAAIRAEQGGLIIADDGGLSTPSEVSAFVDALAAARGIPRP